DRGPDRAQRVVLAHQRYAEHGHHLVADELLDRAAVALDHTDAELEEVGHDAPQRLGVESLGESGGRDNVTEQHRHRLARLQGRVDGKWCPAGPAEVGTRRVPGPAGAPQQARPDAAPRAAKRRWVQTWRRDSAAAGMTLGVGERSKNSPASCSWNTFNPRCGESITAPRSDGPAPLIAATTRAGGALPRAPATNNSAVDPARPSAPANSTAVSLW